VEPLRLVLQKGLPPDGLNGTAASAAESGDLSQLPPTPVQDATVIAPDTGQTGERIGHMCHGRRWTEFE
jgi:hypothetical protein